jgi:hypothetical protein
MLFSENCGASLRRTDEGVCPYVRQGRALFPYVNRNEDSYGGSEGHLDR